MLKDGEMEKRCGFTLLIAWAALCFVIPHPLMAAEDVITLKYSDFFPADHKVAKLSEEWCREIEKRTKNRVRFIYFAHNALLAPDETYDGVVRGTADVGQGATAFTPGKFPLTAVLSLPLGYTSGYLATRTADAFYRALQPKEFSDTKVMYLHGSPPSVFMVRKAITKTEDLKGFRIRTMRAGADIPPLVGAVSVATPMEGTYDALGKGYIDGVLLPVESLKSWRFGEVLRTVLENYAFSYSATMFVVMNKSKFDSLPEDIRQVIEKVNREYMEKQGKLWNQLDKEGHDAARGRAVGFVEVSKREQAKWAEKVRPLYEKYLKEAAAKGLQGEEALKFCLDYVKSHR
jgi:TRAP-type transport system periplasmic protein